jgi:ADP-L-glycero-D-manno-heptose 6-epimerase
MELPARIEYIDLPEALRGRYQYFTQAETGKLRATGCPVDFSSLEDSVRDYVREHLQQPRPYLSALG